MFTCQSLFSPLSLCSAFMINFVTANYSFPLLSPLFFSFSGIYASLPSLYFLVLPIFFLSSIVHLYQHPFIQYSKVYSSLLSLLFLILNFLILLSPHSYFLFPLSFPLSSSLPFIHPVIQGLLISFFIFSRCFPPLFYLFFPRCSSLFLFYPVYFF